MPPPRQPEPQAVITTWGDLRQEVRSLRDFYKAALACTNDLVVAADLADPVLLSRVLEKHASLKAHRVFKVSNDLIADKTPPLALC